MFFVGGLFSRGVEVELGGNWDKVFVVFLEFVCGILLIKDWEYYVERVDNSGFYFGDVDFVFCVILNINV